jgi:hypothetical protein
MCHTLIGAAHDGGSDMGAVTIAVNIISEEPNVLHFAVIVVYIECLPPAVEVGLWLYRHVRVIEEAVPHVWTTPQHPFSVLAIQ